METKHAAIGKRRCHKRRRIGKASRKDDQLRFGTSTPILQPICGVATEDSYLVQHYLCNLSRLALAVDYSENGYRSLLKIAVQNEGIMDGLLALSASHFSRWQKTSDNISRSYFRRAAKALKARFGNVELAQDCATVALILLFVSYEVFLGSTRWRAHYDAIRAWIQSRDDCSNLDPFIKTWICMVDTQCALNTGLPGLMQLESWMEDQGVQDNTATMIDPLFGCSVQLPPLMAAASRLFIGAKGLPLLETIEKVNILKGRIQETKMDINSQPTLSTTCQSIRPNSCSMITNVSQHDLPRRVMATAEIFRHATEIYVHRIAFPPGSDESDEVTQLVQAALQSMTLVPDALGPGANLGWCFVVIGSELDEPEQRDYIRSRVSSLHQLGMLNSKSSEKILEYVWAHRDLVACGLAQPLRWQDVMQEIGEQQILV